jgi:predicted PhzF superfamily epimerase YddE/YHI9
MDFPADMPKRIDAPTGLADALGVAPREVWSGQYLLAVFDSAAQIRALAPDMTKVAALGGKRMDVCSAAPGDGGHDVISRFFAPADGIPVDPATGSTHCVIAPFFSERLGRHELNCFQAHPGRGAHITTRMAGSRVKLDRTRANSDRRRNYNLIPG